MSTDQNRLVADVTETAQPHRFQFGISSMFWETTGTAIVCTLLFQMPALIAIPAMLFISAAVLPAVWTVFIIYGRGYQRTFGIGAMFPTAPLMLFSMGLAMEIIQFRPRLTNIPDDEFVFRLVMFGFWLSNLLVGGICIGVRKQLDRTTK